MTNSKCFLMGGGQKQQITNSIMVVAQRSSSDQFKEVCKCCELFERR